MSDEPSAKIPPPGSPVPGAPGPAAASADAPGLGQTGPKQKRNEPRRVERLSGAHLEISIGEPLSLDFPTQGKKYAGKVVGYEPYAFIAVMARLPKEVLDHTVGGAGIVAHHVVDGVVFGFRVELLNRITNPAPILFLSFPETVDRIALRHDPRLNVNLPGKINGKYGEQAVLVQDLTLTGCQLSARVDLKTPLREAQVNDRLMLQCEMGGNLRIVEPIELRRVVTEKGLLRLGAQFVELSPGAQEQLQAYLGDLMRFMEH